MRRRSVLLGLVGVLAGCGRDGGTGRPPSPPDRAVVRPRVAGDVATGLDVPWGVGFLPDGDALITERDSARILRVGRDGATAVLGTVPDAVSAGGRGEGGLLGLAISPRFALDRRIFTYYSTVTDNRVVRLELREGRLGQPEPIVTGIPSGNFHDGGRVLFGPDGMLYVGTGDARRAPLAQNPGSRAGKILRVTPDGQPAPGNPFGRSPVYSFGHRNVQGLAFDGDGRLWAAEHGADRWDELNLIRPGANYGWPRFEGRGDSPSSDMLDPVTQWRPAEASPSGVAVVGDSIYMAALRGERLWRVPLSGTPVPREYFVGEYGRLRTIARAPDDTLWVTTSNRDGRGDPRSGDDRILRIIPGQ